MRTGSRFSRMLIISVLPLFSQPCAPGSTEQKEVRVEGAVKNYAAEERFVDRGDGAVIDTSRKIMWQKGDNGKEVTFEEAQAYCKTLRLGGYADWRLPNPDERDTAVAVVLMMPRHSRDAHAHLDLYWSSNRSVLIPFNYQPASGKEVSAAYFAREGTRAFVRAVRSSAGIAKPDGSS